MSDFMGVILTLCHDLLGLENTLMDYTSSEYAQDFLDDIWFFDENTRVQERSPIDMNRNKFVSYVALCHRQMKYQFPKGSKIPVFWPWLWGVTIIRFLKNNDYRKKLAFNLLKK